MDDRRTDEAVLEREAARVALVDPDERVLLVEGHDPSLPEAAWYWFTVGGGLDAGETHERAAVREVREETGIALDEADLGTVVRTDVVDLVFEGRRLRQRERWFVVRVDAVEPDRAGWTPLERRMQRGMRWWTLDELRTTDRTVYPGDLADLVEHALRDGRR